MTDRNFPQEARLDHAVSQTKGCYIGQEIVARIYSRGAVKKILVKLQTEAPVQRGDAISVGATVLGEVTSAAVSPENGPLALGYVKVAQSTPGTALEVGGVPGVVMG